MVICVRAFKKASTPLSFRRLFCFADVYYTNITRFPENVFGALCGTREATMGAAMALLLNLLRRCAVTRLD